MQMPDDDSFEPNQAEPSPHLPGPLNGSPGGRRPSSWPSPCLPAPSLLLINRQQWQRRRHLPCVSGLLDDGRSQDPRNELPTLCEIGIQVLEVL